MSLSELKLKGLQTLEGGEGGVQLAAKTVDVVDGGGSAVAVSRRGEELLEPVDEWSAPLSTFEGNKLT